MAKLTYADLKKQGVVLTKEEAQLLHSPINNIAQRGDDDLNDLFPDNKQVEEVTQTGGISNMQQSTGFNPDANKQQDAPKETAAQKKAREKQEAIDAKQAEEAKLMEEKRLNALKEAGLEEREVTQDDLDNDPTLVEAEIQIGDIHEFPIEKA